MFDSKNKVNTDIEPRIQHIKITTKRTQEHGQNEPYTTRRTQKKAQSTQEHDTKARHSCPRAQQCKTRHKSSRTQHNKHKNTTKRTPKHDKTNPRT